MDSTPIASLPDMGHNNAGSSGGGGGNMHASQTSTYTPLNPHKNPYMDAPPSNAFMPPPVHVGAGRSNDMRNIPNIDDMQQYTLPSRDIPRNTDILTQDEQVIPSYIPRHSRENIDYIPDSIDFENEKRKNGSRRKKQVHFAEDSLNDLQEPLILALVFFIFHLPSITNLFCKYLGSFGFAGIDGNINVAGIMLKSILFGIIVYGYKYMMSTHNDA